MLPEPLLVDGNLLELGVRRIGKAGPGMDRSRKCCIYRLRPAGIGKPSEEALVAGEIGWLGNVGGERVAAALNFLRLVNVEAVRRGDPFRGLGIGRIGIDENEALHLIRVKVGEGAHVRRSERMADEDVRTLDARRVNRVMKLGRDPLAGPRHRSRRAESVTRPVEAAGAVELAD